MEVSSSVPRSTGSSTQKSEFQIAATFLKKSWQSSTVRKLTFLWFLGLFCMLLAPAPIKVTEEMKVQYENMVIDAANMDEYADIMSEVIEADNTVYDAKNWFWRFNANDREKVHRLQEVADKKHATLNSFEYQRQQNMRNAKNYVGLWSEYGVAEARTRFWDSFEAGKVFATRQTFWQMFFSLLQSKEESMLSLVLNWVFVTLVNFTFGLIGSLFYFVFSLFSMVYSYNPDPLSAFSFYSLALLGGISTVAAYLIAMYGFVAGSGYVLGKAIVHNARLQHEQQQRLRPQRPHYD